jgi:glyoxylase-like metal-dependent hydrolase (beta-lactamase superfamily II)
MAFKKRLDNVYVIDTNMFGYPEYMSVYLIQGKELALVDTGLPNQFDHILSGFEEHGFSPKDISYIFLTHCEHPDHSGNDRDRQKMY